jgi:ubiquinone/menaquinone biosynthesis C-methylase UbiE
MPDDAYVIATSDAYERYAEAYAHTRSDRSAVRPYIERFVAMLPGGARVLDVGCGPGVDTGSLALRGVHTVGLDIAAAMLLMAAPHSGGRVVQADQRRLPFADETFDGVWANACLLHLAKRDLPGALLEMQRVLGPGAVLYTAMQRGASEALEQPVNATSGVAAPRFFARYESDEWLTLLRQAGFEPLPTLELDDAPGGDKYWLHVFARRP